MYERGMPEEMRRCDDIALDFLLWIYSLKRHNTCDVPGLMTRPNACLGAKLRIAFHFQLVILYLGFVDAPEHGSFISDETSMGFVYASRIRVSVSGEIEHRKELVEHVYFLKSMRLGKNHRRTWRTCIHNISAS